MESLLWLSIGGALVYALIGACGLAIRIGRPSEEEFGFSAAASFSLSAFCLARAVQIAWPDEFDPFELVGEVAAIAVLAFTAHFVVAYTRPKHARLWTRAAYGIAFLYVCGAVWGGLRWASSSGDRTERVLAVFERPATAFGWSIYVVATIAAALFVLGGARRWMETRLDAIGVTLGSAALLAAIVHDAAVASGSIGGPWLLQLGLLSFLFGTGATFIVRYVSVANELETSRTALEERTRQLRQSYQDLHETQEELVRKEQLAVVGELAAVVAHEVRNPLAVISNAVAGLRKPSLSRDDQMTLLGILEDESSRLNRLVSDLLRYARPVSVQRASVMLDDVLERALRFARGTEGITVEKDVETEKPCVSGDASLLRQVFDNLVDNAVQAMPLGGTLTIRVKSAREEEVDGISVVVADTGEGMDTIVRARARDPFFTTRPSGTGLGLAIVDRIVEAHAGHLLIQSRAGEGTTVTVFLPAARASEIPEPRREAS